jgi:hypothetical protein
MKCKIEPSLLDGLIDDQLSIKEQLEINTHLIQCIDCQELLALKQRTKALIFKMSAPSMSDDFELGLQQKIAASKTQNTDCADVENVVALGQSPKVKINYSWLAAACAVIAVTSMSLVTMLNPAQDEMLVLDKQPLMIEISTPIFSSGDVQLASIITETDDQGQGFWTDNQTDSFDQFTQIDSGYQAYSCGGTVGERGCTLGPGKMVASLTVKSAI